jgi:ribonuclease BN (tRNA processing enzyme)
VGDSTVGCGTRNLPQMDLTIIGAGPAYTDRRGAASSSYLVRFGDAALLLDLGQGAFANLAATVEPSGLAAVIVSHLHPDHFVDLVALRHYLTWEFRPVRRVGVLGPQDLGDRLDALNGQPGFAAVALDVEALAEGKRRFGPFEVEARLVAHTGESYAFRVSATPDAAGSGEEGGDTANTAPGGTRPGLVYSGDCANAEDLLPLIHPGDTLLSEASFGAGPVAPGAQHITSGEAARIAATGRAARLLLTHVLSGYSRDAALAAARDAFGGPVQLVTEGDRFEV